MKALPLSDATRRLGAPQGWDHERDGLCHTLDILDREGWMISAWSPSAAELARLNAGEPLFLHIQGIQHPVIAMTIGNAVEERKISNA